MNCFKPAGHPAVSPYLPVVDVKANHAFLHATFAASPLSNIQRQDGAIRHAETHIGDSVVMLGTWPNGPDALHCSTHVYVPDVDDCHRRALAAGAASITEPADRTYGDRTCGVRDRDGHVWWIGTRSSESERTP